MAQAWKMTTETVAITANTITMDVLDGVFIRPSGLIQLPRAYKHKIRQESGQDRFTQSISRERRFHLLRIA